MVAVSLCDTLRFQTTSDDQLDVRCIHSQTLRAAGYAIPSGAENLAWRALERLRNATTSRSRQLGGGLDIFKRVPDQAGLGGGSSDAAAALRAARLKWQLPIDDAEFAGVAAEVGSDVTFFVEQGISLCRGRGETMTPLHRNSPLWFVVTKPAAGLSTRTVYEHLTLAKSPRSAAEICAAIDRGTPREIGRLMRNRLQQPAESLMPEIRRAAAEFARLDVCGHQLSGSGSAYFGLFANRTSAVRAEQILRSRLPGWFVISCHSLSRLPFSIARLSPAQETSREHN